MFARMALAPHRWSADMDDALIRMAGESASVEDMARAIGKSIESIQTRANRLGVTLPRRSYKTTARRRISMLFSG